MHSCSPFFRKTSLIDAFPVPKALLVFRVARPLAFFLIAVFLPAVSADEEVTAVMAANHDTLRPFVHFAFLLWRWILREHPGQRVPADIEYGINVCGKNEPVRRGIDL